MFNPEKLDWFNAQHLARLSGDDLLARIEPALRAAGLWADDLASTRRGWFLQVVELVKPRWRKLEEIAGLVRPFLVDRVEWDEAAAGKHLSSRGLADAVEALAKSFASLTLFDRTTTELALRALAEARQLKAAALIHPTRVAVTGQSVSPGIFEVLELVGRARVVSRLRAAAAHMAAHPGPSRT